MTFDHFYKKFMEKFNIFQGQLLALEVIETDSSKYGLLESMVAQLNDIKEMIEHWEKLRND